MSRTLALFSGLLLCLNLGCGGGQSKPNFEPILVSGKVLETNGNPISEGLVSLRSVPNGEYLASGKIENGAFKLKTIVESDKVDGIPAGEYRVQVARFSTNQADLPVDLKKTYKIDAGQSELVIKME